MGAFSAQELQRTAAASGMMFPAHVLDQFVAAIDSGKHVILTGPPGTGKTTLAYMAAEVAQRAMLCTGYLPTTATTEWTTFETIGGLQPTAGGPDLPARASSWTPSRAGAGSSSTSSTARTSTGPSASSSPCCPGQPVVLPFKRKGTPNPLSIVPAGVEPPPHTDVIRLPSKWRIIATMNVFDKNLLFEMSYALMRRFAFIEVGAPDDESYRRLLRRPRRDRQPSSSACGSSPTSAPPSTSTRPSTPPAGPRTGRRRPGCSTRSSTPTSSRSSRACDDLRATKLYRTIEGLFDPPEQAEVQRTMGEVLGVELAL